MPVARWKHITWIVASLAGCAMVDLDAQLPKSERLPFDGVTIGVGDDTTTFLGALRRAYGVEVMMAGRLVLIQEGGRGSAPRGYVALDSLGRVKQVHREWPDRGGDAATAFEALHRVLSSAASAGRAQGAAPVTCQLVPSKIESGRGVLDRVEFRCPPWIVGLTAVPQSGGQLRYTVDLNLSSP
jgi:hypothetical protein